MKNKILNESVSINKSKRLVNVVNEDMSNLIKELDDIERKMNAGERIEFTGRDSLARRYKL